MGALDLTHVKNIVDASLGTSAFTATTTPIHIRLMTAVGTESANGTELATSGGYTSGTGAPTLTFAAADANHMAISNSVVTVTNMPTSTITAIELWDSNATPKRKWWGLLGASRTFVSGDTLSFASGSVTASIP